MPRGGHAQCARQAAGGCAHKLVVVLVVLDAMSWVCYCCSGGDKVRPGATTDCGFLGYDLRNGEGGMSFGRQRGREDVCVWMPGHIPGMMEDCFALMRVMG